jgi:hypothetical protein
MVPLRACTGQLARRNSHPLDRGLVSRCSYHHPDMERPLSGRRMELFYCFKRKLDIDDFKDFQTDTN